MSNIDADAVTKAIQQFSTDADLAHQFVQGGDDETVVLGNEETPTLRKLAKDIGKQSLDQVLAQGVAEITAIKNETQTLYEQTEDVLPQIEVAKNAAVESAVASIESKENASVAAMQQEGAAQVVAITAEGNTQVERVQTEGDTQYTRLEDKGEELYSSFVSVPVGATIAVRCSSTYVPEGCIPEDGAQYSKAQFSDLWDNYLITGLLKTCTYAEAASQISATGACNAFAVDVAAQTFKAPLTPNGYVVQQAQSDPELGKAYKAGLPNIQGSLTSVLVVDGNTASGAFTRTDESPHNLDAGGGTLEKRDTVSFNASRSSSIYGNSTTVQPKAIALRHFVVVATGSINQSMMDWSAWASGLAGKLDIEGAAIVSMPSSNRINIGWSNASSPDYTAPANGYMNIIVGGQTAYMTIHAYMNGKLVFTESIYDNVWAGRSRVFPVQKDMVIKAIRHETLNDYRTFLAYFVYAQGEI